MRFNSILKFLHRDQFLFLSFLAIFQQHYLHTKKNSDLKTEEAAQFNFAPIASSSLLVQMGSSDTSEAPDIWFVGHHDNGRVDPVSEQVGHGALDANVSMLEIPVERRVG